MCNSYQQGHCNYYGVDVKEMDYKCERGDCMAICECGCGVMLDCKESNVTYCASCHREHGPSKEQDGDLPTPILIYGMDL
jgi:hypothetical protein